MHVRASVRVRACVRVQACMCTFCVRAFVYDFDDFVFVHVYARSCACARPVYSLFLSYYFLLLISYFLLLIFTSFFLFLTSYFRVCMLLVHLRKHHTAVRPSVCLYTCKSMHMHTSPRLYLCMYVCNHVCMCGFGCVRACVRASVRMYVCFRTQMCKCIHSIFHGRANVHILCECVCVCVCIF